MIEMIKPEYVIIYQTESKTVHKIVRGLDELKKEGAKLQKARIDYKVLTNMVR